ncbi:hypothetical protein LTR36_004770 [Oleoguttula mirabilis]|uniref:Nitrogen permease regulator 2 n=1 Tax=Oleoguttula mirabilis TaxID=1507867 RepID=A0AAV9JGP9_9PEZI|nr:hypothetical protein LTR36_004770 [Oleoguttula mirabilis]
MLKAIFYARFHPGRGPSVIHQYPNGSIMRDRTSNAVPLLSFSDISAYIIPPYELCNKPLSICTEGYRVLGFPMSPEDAKYERNRFTFNVCFVLDESADARPWEPIVRKAAAFFRAMEEEDGLLQAEESLEGLKWAGEDGYPTDDIGIVRSLLETILEDVNAYAETCIRINELHVLNLRLTPHRPAPPKVRAWNVPLLIRALPSPEEWTWDLTLQRIYPHLDGVKHVQCIAELADVELKLVKRAVRELMYHDHAILLDLFHFQAIYAPTADLVWFVQDREMLEECCQYVTVDQANNILSSDNNGESNGSTTKPTAATMVALYSSLGPGFLLYDFVLAHEAQLANVDIRRFITFGVIKGFLRRVHKYALAIESSSSRTLGASDPSPSKSKPKSGEDIVKEFDRAWKRAALTSGWATPPTEPPAPVVAAGLGNDSKISAELEEARSEKDEKLGGYMDGKHCMDEICVAVKTSEKKVVERIKDGRFGEVVLFNR